MAMLRIALRSGSERLAPTLDPARFTVVDAGNAEVEVASGDAAETVELVEFVLGGGRLVVFGGDGPLLSALHFARHPDETLSGVGYTLLDGRAVGGPRGDGWALFVWDEAALAEALDWISLDDPGAACVQ